jgi:hypothetical protein
MPIFMFSDKEEGRMSNDLQHKKKSFPTSKKAQCKTITKINWLV